MASPQRAKVLLLIPHLGGGGSEHVIATLARHLNPRKYELHLGLVTQSAYEAHDFPQWHLVHPLGARRVRYSAWSLLRLIWRIRPAVILSGIAHLNLLVLMLQPLFPQRTCVLVRQNGTLSATLAATGNPRPFRKIFAAAYRSADRVICQTQHMAEELQRVLGIDRTKLVVLPNPVDIHTISALAAAANNSPHAAGPRCLAVARLAPEKGIDLLLEAFVGVRRRFPPVQLEVAGSGPCEAVLKAHCATLGIEDSVKFLGQVTAPVTLFPGASLFVLSSRHEGLPNALLEAAAAGLPIVALPASPGIAELLSGQSGIWIADEVSSVALEHALLNALSSTHPGQRFHHPWIEAFALTNAIPAYEDVIEQALRDSGK